MIRKATLDFKEVDIEEYLFPRIPVRFQGTDPREFEDFIAHFFETNGYSLREARYSPEFGADLIVDYEGESFAVQIKRYHESHKVGVAEVKQLGGARDYYRCDRAIMITTSSFDRLAKKYANEEEVLLWDWYQLHQFIADTFLEGNYEHYFEKYPVTAQVQGSDLSLRLISIDLTRSKLSLDGKTTVHAELENQSEQPLNVYCDLPSYVTHQRNQYQAIEWAAGSFRKGEIYGKAVVPLAFSFSNKHLSKYHRQDRVILKVHSMISGESFLLEQKMKKLKKECFFITYSFTRDSAEYEAMIRFREEKLTTHAAGRSLIASYYSVSRHLVSWISQIPYMDLLLRPLLRLLVKVFGVKVGQESSSSEPQTPPQK